MAWNSLLLQYQNFKPFLFYPVSCRALPLWEEEMSLVTPDWFHWSSLRQKRAYQTLAPRGQLADPQTTCHIQNQRAMTGRHCDIRTALI
jgi:hypothetical protein